MSAASSSSPTLTANFPADKAKALITALSCLSKVQINKIVLEFSKTDTEKTLFINAVNSVNTVFARVKFDASFLDGVDLQENFKYGINDLGDFVGLLEIFKAGFVLKMSNEIASISSDENYLDYYGGEESKIRCGPDGELESDVLATIKCDDSFKSLMEALGRLTFEHIIFKGSAEQKSVAVSVADKDVRGNNFTKKLSVPTLEKNFRVVIMKEFLKNVITTSCDVIVHQDIIETTRVDDLFKIDYYISTLT
jgi:hypothetical protein